MSAAEIIRFCIDLSTRFIAPLHVAAEWVLVAAAALCVAALPARAKRLAAVVPKLLRDLGSRRRLALVVCGLTPVVVRLCLLPLVPAPEPSIHDEFSHLLLADTLSHGRLTNPTHPMWRHLESIHVIQRPTYNSMYPPGQGAILALGQTVFGDPWAGAVIGAGLMCAAICWMLQGWLRPAWALFGALIVILKIGIFTFWVNSYMGGAVAAIGGALLVGAAPRLRRPAARPVHSALFAAGLVILINTRPFEGAILTAAVALYVLPALRWKWRKSARAVCVLLAPGVAVAAAGVLFVGYYNWRVTGSPGRLPYMVNRDTYGWPENLAFLPPKHPSFRHTVLKNMFLKEAGRREQYWTVPGFFASIDTRLFDNWTVLVGPVLTAPLLLFPALFRRRRTRPLVVFLCLIAALNLFQLVLYPYHLGPVVPILFALIAEGARHLYIALSRVSRRPMGGMIAAMTACLLLSGAMKQWAAPLGLPLSYWEIAAEPHRDSRASIVSWLEARPGPQLVVVRYSAWHPPDQEWVYNGADIDGSKVVWAREMGSGANGDLLRYFSGREVWLLEADVWPQHLRRYAGDGPPSTRANPGCERSEGSDRGK